MRRLYILFIGILALLMSYAAPAMAATPSLGFDSDITQRGEIAVCNPENIYPARVNQIILDWNAATQILPGTDPQYYLSESATIDDCELRIDNRGGVNVNYYARVVFTTQPDRLDFSQRYLELGDNQRRGTADHEGGHAGGIAHPPVTRYWCGASVVAQLGPCKDAGFPRRYTIGDEDSEAMLFYWDKTGSQPIEDGVEGPNPVTNKCWYALAADDANGDGVCDHYGPPGGPGDVRGAATLSTQNVGPKPVPVPEDRQDSVVFIDKEAA